MTKHAVLSAHQWRFACKEFDTTKVISQEDLDFLLEVVRLSPSSFGLQPYQVLVLKNRQLIDELGSAVWGGTKQIPKASEVLLFVTRKDIRFDSKFIEYMIKTIRNIPSEMLEMYLNLIQQHQQVDFSLLTDQRYLQDWAGKQVYIALGNLMTAAAEIGIDSCPIEGFTKEMVTELLVKNRVINTELHEICVFCTLGYRLAPPPRAKSRQPMDELVKYIY